MKVLLPGCFLNSSTNRAYSCRKQFKQWGVVQPKIGNILWC
jgi:hypothetical protein